MRSVLLLFLTFHFSLLTSSARSIQTINAEKAREVAREQVVWQDRLCPFSTFALDFLKSVYGKSNYKGLSPEQVVYTLGYKLNTLGSDLPERMRQMARESSAAISLDEKVGDIILLTRGQLFQPRPADMEPLPAWRVEGEILWNNTPSWAILLIVTAVVALLAFFLGKAMKRPLKTV